jgi:hypothetical protein
MSPMLKRQQGASSFAAIIVLALVGAGIYLGLQYIPQLIESGTVDAILSDIKKAHVSKPARELQDLNEMIGKALNINQMEELRKNFTVTENNAEFFIDVAYARELNLLVTRQKINYNKSLALRKRNSYE